MIELHHPWGILDTAIMAGLCLRTQNELTVSQESLFLRLLNALLLGIHGRDCTLFVLVALLRGRIIISGVGDGFIFRRVATLSSHSSTVNPSVGIISLLNGL
jgi:hypothetical protein